MTREFAFLLEFSASYEFALELPDEIESIKREIEGSVVKGPRGGRYQLHGPIKWKRVENPYRPEYRYVGRQMGYYLRPRDVK